ncbi:MAG TPA: GNAT family protein, partial [Negativicutes bacterium]|nr:GNAT family protein [Negativicutes bacterium]
NNPDVLKYLEPGIPYPMTLNEELRWFEGISAFKDAYRFAVETVDEGLYIGDCGINSIDWKNSIASVTISIGNLKYQSKGYGTEAMSLLVSFAFREANLNKLRLSVYAFNERAIKSYKKCGFQVEGVLRQELFRDGKYNDVIAMGLIRDEYMKKNDTEIQ